MWDLIYQIRKTREGERENWLLRSGEEVLKEDREILGRLEEVLKMTIQKKRGKQRKQKKN